MEQKKKKGNEVVVVKKSREKVEWGRSGGHWGAGVSRLGAGGWRESRIKVDGSPWGKGKEKPEKSFLKFNFFPALFLPIHSCDEQLFMSYRVFQRIHRAHRQSDSLCLRFQAHC